MLYLAVSLGRANVDGLARQLTARQFLEWQTYYGLEPFGSIRADWHNAQAVAMAHNVAVKKEHQKPVKDFLIPLGEREEPRRTSAEQQAAILAGWVAQFDPRIVKRGPPMPKPEGGRRLLKG